MLVFLQNFVTSASFNSSCGIGYEGFAYFPNALVCQPCLVHYVRILHSVVLVRMDLPYTPVFLPAEKAELAQLEMHAHGAIFAICREDLAPAYPVLVK